MNITHTKIVTVPVSDQDRAKTFYVDTLGFEVLVDQQAGPMRWLQVAPKGAQTSFTLAGGQPGLTPGTARGIILETTDLDGDCAQLAEAGVDVEGPADRPWGREATVIDPDGNRLVLAAPAPARR
ncbi:VOC family protein [Streptomyces mirabilis]|uniref:VOC family protein n=1 Tax=Streptomyces mirabilis TaxID=68239 RepID=UPI003678C30C